MIDLNGYFEDVKEFCPAFVKTFYDQSEEVRKKIIDLFFKHFSLVSAEEYRQQIEFFHQLKNRCDELEKKLNDLSLSKKALTQNLDV
jgi:hypothetical protein